jgi:hypothetical protein
MRVRRTISSIFFLALWTIGQTRVDPNVPKKGSSVRGEDGGLSPSVPSIVELLHTNYRFANDGTGEKVVIAQIRILNQAGTQQWRELTFDYRPFSQTLEITYIRIRKKSGNVVEVESGAMPPSQNHRLLQLDLEEKRVLLPSLLPGDTIEYSVRTRFDDPVAPGHFWVQHSFQPSGVLDQQLAIDVPQARKVKLKSADGLKSWSIRKSDRLVYHWSASKRQENQTEPRQVPDVQLSSFESWEQVGRWYAAVERNRRIPTPDVKAKADKLTDGLSSDIEKIQSLYNFSAKQIKYLSLVSLGVGGYVPHSAGETIQNQYGDCKDKVALLEALLEAEGFKAFSALASPSDTIDADVPSPWPFTHVIVLLQLGNDEVWMDPSPAVLPFRMLAYPLRGKQALVIRPAGESHFETTPSEGPFPNAWSESVDGRVDQNGTLNATVNITARGDAELPIRQAFIVPAESVWQFTIQSFVSGVNRKTDKISDVKVSDPRDTERPFTVFFKITRPKFIDFSVAPAELKLPFSDSHLPTGESRSSSTDWHRAGSEPFRIGAPCKYLYEARLEFGTNFSVVLPAAATLTQDYANYDAKYHREGNALVAERQLVTRRDEISPAISESYMVFRERVLADQETRIAVSKTIRSQ